MREIAGQKFEENLSVSQMRFWLDDQTCVAEGTHATNSIAVAISGTLDTEVLTRAMELLSQRHPLLRMRIKNSGGIVGAEILEAICVPLRIVRTEEMNSLDRMAIVDSIERQDARKLALDHAPLWEAVLIVLAPRQLRLVLTFHELICDGWSVNVFLRDLFSIYESVTAGKPSPVFADRKQFDTYIRRERDFLSSSAAASQRAYWRRKMLEPLPAFNRIDWGRPANYEVVLKRLEGVEPDRLRDAARKAKSTPFVALFAAFARALALLTGEDEIAVCVPAAVRAGTAEQEIIGPMMNLLLCRLSGALSSESYAFLTTAHREIFAALSNRDLPLELWDESAALLVQPRDIVTVVFNLLQFPVQIETPSDFTVQDVHLLSNPARFKLKVYVGHTNGEWMVRAVFDKQFIGLAQVEEIIASFHGYLHSVVAGG